MCRVVLKNFGFLASTSYGGKKLKFLKMIFVFADEVSKRYVISALFFLK